MGFIVDDNEPPLPRGLVAGDTIAASSMWSLINRDRYLFATRRRLIASLPSVTTSSVTLVPAYGFQAKLLPTATGNIVIGVAASTDCTVVVTTSYGAITLTAAGTPSFATGTIYAIPTGAWFGVTVEVRDDSGSGVTIYGIYIVDEILSEPDLP